MHIELRSNISNCRKAIYRAVTHSISTEVKLYIEAESFSPYADITMRKLIRQKQEEATQDDYRIGMIRDFLETKTEVCIPMLWHEALKMRSDLKPTRKDSNEIALIMQNMTGWERQESPRRFRSYSLQKYWKYKSI